MTPEPAFAPAPRVEPARPAPRARPGALKRTRRYLRYLLVRAAVFAVGLLPLRVARALGRGFGRLAFGLASGERKKALRSLARAFPERDEAQRRQIARDCFRHLGECAAEICCVRAIDRRIEHYVDLPPEARTLLERLVARGKGVVFVTAHVGNFELLARRLGVAGFPCHTIAKEASDPRTTAFIESFRASGKLVTIWRGSSGSAKQMLRALRDGHLLGILIDQDTRVQGVFVDFFGHPAYTPRAAADLALRTGAAAVAAFIHRLPDGTHRMSVQEVLPPEKGSPEERVLALTAHFTRLIEATIRSAPQEWVWMHERWKTQRQ